jgi:pilus assembly protein CpaF
MVDARLPDGSRVNAVIHPVALDGPSLSIRRFRNQGFTLEQLVGRNMLAPEMAELLSRCVQSRLNIIISGGSGAGKTTLLNAMSDSISPQERVVTIEDAAELKLRQEHIVRLETKPPNVEGSGEITTRDAVRNALRMRPDRILVGECRGAEAFDMLQAMNSGHSGSMTTMHANGPVDAFRRLESMLCMAGMEVPVSVMREYVGSAINVVIQVERMGSGDRRVVSISEVRPIEGGAAQIEDIFRFQLSGTDGRSGYYEATGCRPNFVDRLKAIGITFDESLFSARRVMEVAPGITEEMN